MIYICLKIYQKISEKTSFSLSLKELDDSYINIEEQLSYVKRKKLVKLDNENQFKLSNPS